MLLEAQKAQGWSDEYVRDQVMTMILAGYETTAIALTWTWYLLSQNEEAEHKMVEEIDRVLEGRLPCYEDLARLRYTEMVLAEALRLYPPAWAMGRLALHDIRTGRVPAASGNDGAGQPIRSASRCALLSRSVALRSRAAYAGGKGGTRARRVLPIRDGAEAVHW